MVLQRFTSNKNRGGAVPVAEGPCGLFAYEAVVAGPAPLFRLKTSAAMKAFLPRAGTTVSRSGCPRILGPRLRRKEQWRKAGRKPLIRLAAPAMNIEPLLFSRCGTFASDGVQSALLAWPLRLMPAERW